MMGLKPMDEAAIKHWDRDVTPSPPLTVLEELELLFTEPFVASEGFYRQGSRLGVCATCAPCSDDPLLVDISVMLFLRIQPIPLTSLDSQAENVILKLCLRLLTNPSPAMRASACQRLGGLARPEALEPLQAIARRDDDECVREAATAALAALRLERLPA